ncbi:MAG TPA: polysaccharide deacetylase family protein [Solirubrobacteraceae bacterium]
MEIEGLRARREDRRRELRRRRTFAMGALLLVLLALLLAALTAGSGGGKARPARASHASKAGKHAAGGHSATATGAGAPALLGHPGTDAVPILMYHVIAPPPAGAPFPGLYVPPQEFAEQMQALKQAGWHAVTPDQVQAYWRRGVSLGAGKPIVLSFDNGYQSQYTQALPVLQRLGWVAEENIQLAGLPPSQGGLLQSQIRGMVAAGWELDTQGYDHADLITLDAAQLHYQVARTREVIQQRFHVPVNWFCYPSGHYDATVVAAVKAAGYSGSTTVVPGWAHRNDDPYRLHRLRVLGGTSAPQLLSELAAVRADPPAPETYTGA